MSKTPLDFDDVEQPMRIHLKARSNVMAEVRKIARQESVPDDMDHVLVEPTGTGRFTVNGNVAHGKSATFIAPQPYDTLDEAMKVASEWAMSKNVGVIFVRTE